LPRALPARYVPPSGFVYPLDGLLPAIPCRLSFASAALLGFTLRSFLLRTSIPGLRTGMNPRTVWPSRGNHSNECRGRPRQLRFLGRHPVRSTWRPNTCLARQPLDAPLGFPFEGSRTKALTGISPSLLSRALPSVSFRGGTATAGRRLRVSIGRRLALLAPPCANA